MIKEVIKLPSDMVIVFDEQGEQIPEYQGSYDQVRDMLLRDAPPTARFIHAVFNVSGNGVHREEW